MPRPIPDHGTNARYQRGCRCDECRPAASMYSRLSRTRLREERKGTVVDGITHGESGYSNSGCRCDTCVATHRETVRAARASRLAARVLVDGRLVAVNALKHGSAATYQNHGCRCQPCTDDQATTHRWVHDPAPRRSSR